MVPIFIFGDEITAITTVPEPLPWWQRVEEIQSLALKWISALTAILGAFAVLMAFVLARVKELKDRMDRGDIRNNVAAIKQVGVDKNTEKK